MSPPDRPKQQTPNAFQGPAGPEPKDRRGATLPESPPWWKTLRADPPFQIRMALGAAFVAVIFLFWWFVTHGSATEAIISPVRLPGPGAVLSATSKLAGRHLDSSIIDTLERVMLGVILAALVGVGLGVLAGTQRGIGAMFGPVIIFLRSIPMGALIPLTLLLFSIGERQKVMFIFLAIVPFVFSDSVKAISIVPERYVETAQTLGASNLQIVWKVLIPLALPDIITSLRFQFGLALGYITLAEVIDAESGLGTLINNSMREANYDLMYLLLFVIAILAFVIDLVIRTLQRGAFQWRRDL